MTHLRSGSPTRVVPVRRVETHSPLWLTAGAAMAATLALLIPGESVAQGGTVLWAMVWLLLWLAMTLRQYWLAYRPDWDFLDVVAILFIAWIISDSYIMGSRSNARLAWNAGWTWVALLSSLVVMRRTWFAPQMQRAVVALAISVATAHAGHGVYQFTYSIPLQRARYEQATNEQRQMMLREAGLDAELGSPVAKQFEDRLRSSEPYASFGLANSLAGVLAPWCVVALALGTGVHRVGQRRTIVTTLLAAAVCLLCLVLTKSRSAWIAVAVVTPFLVVPISPAVASGRVRHGWLILVTMIVVCTTVALAWGALDRQVVTEALLSLQYRGQYWQAALAMWRDHPWWGCGPGNFQTYYVQYKLPEASETVADPHQFLLEVAATLGTPGLLVFLVLVGLVVGRQWLLPHDRPEEERSEPLPGGPASGLPGGRAYILLGVYGGALLAVVLAPLYGWAVDVPAERMPGVDLPVVWVIGIPLATMVLAGLHPWVRYGTLPRSWIGLGLAVLGIHLSAAGGISYPNVAQSVWLLAALAVPVCRRDPSNSEPARGTTQSHRHRHRQTGRRSQRTLSAALFIACITALAASTAYRPVVEGTSLMRQAAHQTMAPQAVALLERATRVDPWHPEPWRWLATLHFHHWVAAPSPETRQAWKQCLEEARRRDRLSYPLAEWEGQLALRAFRLRGEPQDLVWAQDAFQRAVQLYPNSAFGHAQFAWTLYVAGQPIEAARHARWALELDQRCPHGEQKLANRKLPEASLADRLPHAPHPRPLSAEQWMLHLRTIEAIDGPAEQGQREPIRHTP